MLAFSNEEHYLGSCRLHLALLLLVLFVGSGVDHQLLTPPWDGRDDVFSVSRCIQWKNMLHKIRTHPLMISLFSPRMKYSCSGVMMHKEFFWPVLGSASMTSVHRFMFTVP